MQPLGLLRIEMPAGNVEDVRVDMSQKKKIDQRQTEHAGQRFHQM